MPRTIISPEEFVRVWQQADSLQEVAEEFGVDKSGLYMRAKRYRDLGIRLKHFQRLSRNQPLDIEALKELAEAFVA